MVWTFHRNQHQSIDECLPSYQWSRSQGKLIFMSLGFNPRKKEISDKPGHSGPGIRDKMYKLALYLGHRSKRTWGSNSSFEQILSQSLQRYFWNDASRTKCKISVCLQRNFTKSPRPIRFSTFRKGTWVATIGVSWCNIKLLQFHMQLIFEKLLENKIDQSWLAKHLN